MRRLLAKTMVERWLRISLAEQAIDRRPDGFLRQRPELLDGTDDAQVEVLAQAGIHDGHRPRRSRPSARAASRRDSEPLPPAAAASPTDRCARKPLGRLLDASRRSSSRARKTPRLLGQRAWISSTMHVRDAAQRVAAAGGQQQMQRFRRGDEDVRRPADRRCRSAVGVSPVRTAASRPGSGWPSSRAVCGDAFEGTASCGGCRC